MNACPSALFPYLQRGGGGEKIISGVVMQGILDANSE